MQAFKSADDALDFAIEREEEAEQFYTDLAGKMRFPGMQEVFQDFAREERGHKEMLLQVKKGKTLARAEKKIADLKLADYLVEVEPSPNMRFQDALILAMKKEKAAYRLYMDLSATTEEANVRDLFIALANEEAKHKLRFETIYDDEILKEH